MEKVDVQNIRDLINHSGWKVLKTELALEIEQIENQIFKIDLGEGNEKVFTHNDVLKRTRNIYKTLLNEPEILINAFGLPNID